MEEFSPYKHVSFKFTMSSLKIAFVLENEVPIWMLGVVSVYLFNSNPDLGNRYGNAILIIVSMIALLIHFRTNNVAHHNTSFFELKLMMVMIVPVLVMISTTLDYYNDPSFATFHARTSQIYNPFMMASLIIYAVGMLVTAGFFIYMIISRTCYDFNASAKTLKKYEHN